MIRQTESGHELRHGDKWLMFKDPNGPSPLQPEAKRAWETP